MTVVSANPNPPVLLGANRRRLGKFQMRLLALDDAQALQALRQQVLVQLDHPDLYVREDDEAGFVRMHLGGHPGCRGETIGVYDGDVLAAYAMMGLPTAAATDNLGHHVELPGRGPADIAHIASCMVGAAYRGHGLQRTLLAARFSLAQAQGRSACIAMVSLHNHASRHNLMREGMRIAWVGEINGLRRQLMALDLGQAWQFGGERVRLVPALDWELQQALTAQGWWGISEVEGPGAAQLVFARHLQDLHDAAPV